MRITFSVILLVLVLALSVCAKIAHESPKAMGPFVGLLVAALIPPVIGNLIIIMSSSKLFSTIGCYIYFLGMDLVMFALSRFTIHYCHIKGSLRRSQWLLYSLLIFDCVQLACNPFTHHAFDTEGILVDGRLYYRLLPYLGQIIHRVIIYSIFLTVLITFFTKMIRSSRFNVERYSVILFTMVFTGIGQTFYIFSRTPVDRSMLGYGLFGLLIFYFSLYYRPMHLLDRMLTAVASDLPEALFFFDSSGRCIWANNLAISLADITNDNFDKATDRLSTLFEGYEQEANNSVWRHTTGSGENVTSYVLEKHIVTDDRNRFAGSFLSVRDDTAEHRTLQREMYNATHDSLTKAYNRAGYDLLLDSIDLSSAFMILLDLDYFKEVNDTYGHETGDRVLKYTAATIAKYFRNDDYICRIGGDEFIVFAMNMDANDKSVIAAKIDQINATLSKGSDGLPPVTVSVGISHGEEGLSANGLFARVDRALYQTKRQGRNGYSFG